MKRFVQGILHPEAFHGAGEPTPFFEGWYVKLVTPGPSSRSIALIPGVFRGRAAGSAHAFIQVVDPDVGRVRYERFDVNAFQGAPDAFDVRIADNQFGASGVRVNLPHCAGEVRFGELQAWPVRWSSPGVMGWYAWIPVMQCYHGIVSLDHPLTGHLDVPGGRLSFEGGRGYIEKDWGRSFPKRWVWMQSNHFDEEGVCLTASIADVPWFGGAFPGFLVGFWRGGKLLRMTTYTGAKVTRLEKTLNGAVLELEDDNHRLAIEARGGRPVGIHMPSTTSMEGVVYEHLGAVLDVRLSRRLEAGGREEVLFESQGAQAAFEVQGDVQGLRRHTIFPGVQR